MDGAPTTQRRRHNDDDDDAFVRSCVRAWVCYNLVDERDARVLDDDDDDDDDDRWVDLGTRTRTRTRRGEIGASGERARRVAM